MYQEPFQLEDEMKRDFSSYILQEKLKQTIYTAQYRPTKQIYAIKVFTLDTQRRKNPQSECDKEIGALKLVKDIPGCVQLFSPLNFEQNNTYGFAMQYCTGGDLFSVINSRQGMKMEYVRYIFRQIVNILSNLQSNRIVHLNINPSNICFDKDFNPVLIDFATAHQLRELNQSINFCGKNLPQFQLPEQKFQSSFPGNQADIFALGVTIFVILTSRYPFQFENEYSLLLNNPKQYWQNQKNKGPPEFKNNLGDDFIDIFTRMTHQQSKERITLEQIISHKFFNNPQIQELSPQNFKKGIESLNDEQNNFDVVQISDKEQQEQSRGLSEEDINQEYEKFEASCSNLLIESRQTKIYNVMRGQLTDFKTSIDPQTLFKYLFIKSDKFTSQIPILSSKQLKLKCLSLINGKQLQQEEEEEEKEEEDNTNTIETKKEIKFSINISIGDENNKTYVIFTKKEGDSLEFFKLVSQIKEIIKEFK